jgi:cyclophilin family peptidyl-prolyl cis-trans isomerase
MRAAAVLAVFALALPAAAQETSPRLAKERIVLHTVAGDIVLALYPDVAPQHVEQLLKLTRLGVYDGTHFCRVEPNFVVQLATALDRTPPLSPEQKAALHPLPAEFSPLKHHRGVLEMAHENNKPDSAESSFSILLADAPHLDGKYTIFGHVEAGMDVVDEMCKVPRNTSHNPLVRLTVTKAEVVDSEGPARLSLSGPRPVEMPDSLKPRTTATWEVAGGVLLMVLCGLVGFFGAKRLPARTLPSIHLLSVLIGGFLLLVLLFPVGLVHPWMAVALFLGVLGLLRVMSQFESSA